MGLLGFLLVLVPLVVIHEFGHFIMAKLGGIRVTRFAVGFGKTLFSFHYKGTEYCWNLLPFGGYVDFMGELVYTNEIPDDVAHFYNRPKWLRFLVLVMGPLFNLLLAFGIFWLLFWVRPYRVPIYPQDTYTVGVVLPDSAAQTAGLQVGDNVLTINGEPMSRADEIHEFFLINPGKDIEMEVERDGVRKTIGFTVDKDYIEGHGVINFYPVQRAMVDAVSPAMGAERAGVRARSLVTHVNGEPVNYWTVARTILRETSSPFTLETQKGPVTVEPYWGWRAWAFNVHLTPEFEDGVWRPSTETFQYEELAQMAQSGAGQPFQLDFEKQTYHFEPEQVEDGWAFTVRLVYRPGEEGDVLSLYGSGFGYPELIEAVENAGPRPFKMEFEGADSLELTPEWRNGRWLVGITFAGEFLEQDLNLQGALVQGWWSFKKNSTLIYKSVLKLFLGDLPIKSLSGPVGVARVAGEALDAGLLPFITLMAVLSLNLGLLNLLPIPVLDGGEIFVLLVEWVARKDFSLATKMRIKMVGFFFIVGLMGIVLFTDVMKIINSIPT